MELPTTVVTRLVQFCRFARDSGYPAAINETVNALQMANVLGISDRTSLKAGLRAVICSSKEEWERFDEVFDEFWMADQRPTQSVPVPPRKREEDKHGGFQDMLSSLGEPRETELDDSRITQGATAVDRLKKVDLSAVPLGDVEELERISLRLIRHMSMRLSRRLMAMTRSGQVDLRRTIRRSIGRGGEPFEISFKGRKQQRSRLVILLDISGSMNTYSIFLLKFAYVLQTHFPQVKTFVFSTRLEDITPALRGHSHSLAQVLDALSERAAGWSGGTKIGESLREFNLLHARKVLTRDTVCIVLSDGWDTGDPEVLAQELATIKRRVRKLIWLNPLLGMTDYQPVTRGMSAALPWIDVFASAHNLESLLELETHLRRD
jgi:uncharacterized protein with von Willebrand factor type A (vWA) domain